jgi:murein L,D-transpeptidase YafK
MTGARPGRRRFAGLIAACAGLLALDASEAGAVSIELKDVAADRIERQRAFVEGRLPLANTPDTSRFQQRIAEAGVKVGAPVLLRIFKETSELEVWIEKGDRFVLFATYPMCHWSGTLGPKQREGDKQTPEGFYTITNRQLHHIGRWPVAINLGFPNAYDRAHDRDGSYILMHGGCSSVGCFAMTNPVMSEIYTLAKAAIRDGQRYVPVHVLPFRMTDEAVAARGDSPWHEFWVSLQAGYTSFERTRRPPRVSVCEGRYQIEDGVARATAQATDGGESRHRKAVSEVVLGAIRQGCPEASVQTADSKGSAAGAAAGASASMAGAKQR